jgi:hypothetical protein
MNSFSCGGSNINHMTTQLHFPNLKALERNGLCIELERNLFLVGQANIA